VYFAGHGGLLGDADGQPFLVVQDTDRSTRERTVGTVIKPTDLTEYLGATKAPQIVITDCCRASSGDDERGAGSDADAAAAEAHRWMFAMCDASKDPSVSRALLYACSAGQVARERDGHGVFTRFLVEGLQGAAGRGDGRITVDDLFGYAVTQMAGRAELQQPERYVGGKAGPIELARHSVPEQKRVTLCRGADGQHRGEMGHDTIAAALAEARPGDTIRLAAGTYYESIVLVGVSLVGAGPEQTVLKGSASGAAVVSATGNGTLAGFRVEPADGRTAILLGGSWTVRDCATAGGTIGVAWPASSDRQGGADDAPHLDLQNLTIRNAERCGVSLLPATGTANLSGCEVTDCRGTCLQSECASVGVTASSFHAQGAPTCGIWADSSCALTVTDSRCSGSQFGVMVTDQAALRATRLQISGTQRSGLIGESRANLSLIDCRVEANDGLGVVLYGEARMEAAGLRASDNGGTNLSVVDRASARVVGAELCRSKMSGVFRQASSSLVLEASADCGCSVSGNAMGGVVVCGEAHGQIRLSAVSVSDNSSNGVGVDGSAALTVEGGSFTGNHPSGLFVRHSGSATVKDAVFAANGSGVVAHHSAAVTASDCRFTGDAQVAISSSGDGLSTVTAAGCQFGPATSEAGGAASATGASPATVVVLGHSTVTIADKCRFAVGGGAIAVGEMSRCVVKDTSFTGGVRGIVVFDDGRLDASGNEFCGQSVCGIAMSGAGGLTAKTNRFADVPCGISIDAAAGSAECADNTAEGNVARLVEDRRPQDARANESGGPSQAASDVGAGLEPSHFPGASTPGAAPMPPQ